MRKQTQMPGEYPSLTRCFLEAVDRYANPRAQMFRGPSGWLEISAKEMLRRVAGLSKALAELGIKPGDRVGLFAPNCPEWHIADFAILGLGAIDVPVYFNESPDRLAYILNDSEARVVITAGDSQARKIAECRKRLRSVEQVISVAAPEDLREEVLRYETLIATASEEEIAEYRRRAAEVLPEQIATIIYTSGTTGEPKGVMLTHSNLSSNTRDSLHAHDLNASDLALSFLPLAHVYERITGYGYLFNGLATAYVPKIDDVPQALLEVHPTICAAVPRFFEKIYANILDRGHHETGIKRRIFDWALRVADDAVPWRAHGRSVSLGLKLQWQIANRLVYSKIRTGLGGGSPKFVSGGAPLAPEIAEFFWAIGVAVYQGYGLTETSPVVSANTPEANRVGSVGRPIPHVQVRIAGDGEILVKGPCVMKGYYHKPAETKEVFTEDGWFRTGDIGRLDEDGYLYITDRKKELLKTAAGKFIAPAPIENTLKSSPYIANAIIVGDRRKFVSVLVVPNFATIQAQARRSSRDFASPGQMIVDPWVRDLIAGEIERLTAPLAQYEKPKRFALLEQDFTYANGELTYTMKMKRRVIEQRYDDVIARLYADVEEPRPHHLA
ncbi:MAG TPA: long-chain fatty acid--CoA ligase [Candidatus Limnocylindrales bacterium]|nr:long-chain fatty acid--CoA ligase [Candidatus Limnocylindrales bacterium]